MDVELRFDPPLPSDPDVRPIASALVAARGKCFDRLPANRVPLIRVEVPLQQGTVVGGAQVEAGDFGACLLLELVGQRLLAEERGGRALLLKVRLGASPESEHAN